jgi:hypothetical protein
VLKFPDQAGVQDTPPSGQPRPLPGGVPVAGSIAKLVQEGYARLNSSPCMAER